MKPTFQYCIKLGLCFFLLTVFTPALKAAPTNTTYTASWASVDQHNPSPEWFQDAKFGIYFHWGIFSVPAHYSEWYGHWCYDTSTNDTTGCYQYQTNTFGYPAISGPPPLFPYDLFITGGTNKAGQFVQFAPKLVSNGGSFDPNAWAAIFVDAGAQFAGPMAEHHDGFSMWASKVNPWNALSNGPQQDLVGELVTAIRAKNLKIVLSFHHAYNFQGFWQFAPQQSTTLMKQMYGQLPAATEDTLWQEKLEECIDAYQPDIIWQDFDLAGIPASYRLNFLSYYYNSALDWNKQVVATYKNSDFDTNGEVLDYERGGPANVLYPYWLTDESVSGFTWGYTSGMSVYSVAQLVDELIDRVAKGGNFLLSCAPMANGVIPVAQTNLLHGIGVWLKQNGEAIYSTRAWTVGGEGPTVLGGPSFNGPKVGTSADIRFTRNKATNVLYAIFMAWPSGGVEKITTLSSTNMNLTTLTNVQLFGATAGTYINLAYTQNTSGLNVTLPSSQPYTATAYALKLSFSTIIPTFGVLVLPPPPAAPSGLTATAASSSQINLTWTDNSTNENNFLVEESSNNVTFTQVDSVAAGVTNDSISGLSASTLYYFRVRASNAGGNSAYSNTNHATTLAPPAGLVWKGDGAANVWDVGVTANWLSGGVAAQFVNGVATTFDDTGSNTPAINLTTNVSPASLTVSASQNYIFGGAGLITGGASLTKSGTGSLTFTNTGNNTFSGGVTISNGIVALGTDSPSPTTENQFALGTGLVTVSTNGQLRFGGKSGGVSNFFITNAVTINGGTLFAADGRQHLSNAVVNVQPAGGTLLTRWKTKDIVIDSVLTGGGPLTVNYGLYVDGVAGDGGGSVYLSSPLNTYSGTLTVLTNTIVLTSPYALSNATLNAQGTGTSSNLVWSGISSITLGGLSGAGNIPLGANQLVVCNNNSSTAYSGVLSGTGSLVTMGGGVFTLSGANTYSGTTTVSGGKLVVNNTAGSGTGFGAVTVGSGGTLGGNGIISGATTVNAGGTLSPGNSPGTLTFSNALTLNSGCTNYFEINKSPVTNDVARVLGALTCGGTLIVTNLGTNALAANDSFKLFNAASYGGAFANVTLPPLAAGLNWNTNALNTNGTLAVVVSVLSTATVLNPLSAVTYGTPVTFTATVSPTPTTGDTVTFKDGVVTMGTGTTSVSGVATFTTTNTQLSAATHSITAVFAGDASFATSTSGASNQVVNQKSLTPVITLNSRPYDGTTSAATIAIRLLTGVVGNDDVNLGTSGVVAAFGSKNAGSSTINITGLSLSGTKAANYLLVSTATTATGTITQTNSITAVSSSANPSYMNDNVKFVATVTGLDTPTGAVQFLTNGLFFDSEALAAGLATSAATTLLPSGTNTVTAAYSGDVNYLASTNSLSQVVVGQPQFNTISVGANGLVMGGSGGIANGTYYVLGTSNMTAPLGLWPPLLTNQFDAVGNFNFTNPMDTNSPQGFYLLQLP